MSEYNTPTLMNGFFKSVYSDKMSEIVPEGTKLARLIPFQAPNKRMGLEYKQPISLG